MLELICHVSTLERTHSPNADILCSYILSSSYIIRYKLIIIMNKQLFEVSLIVIAIQFADISHVCSFGCVVVSGNNSTVVVKLIVIMLTTVLLYK